MRIFCFSSILACSALANNPGQIIGEANKKASYQPKSQQFINAAMIFDWEPSRIYQIYTKPGLITDIALEPGEKLDFRGER